MTPKQQLIESLRLLCEREGGRKAVADAIKYNEQTLWQVLAGTKLPSGESKGIGARMQKRLDERYPGWHELWNQQQDGEHSAIYIPLLENAASMGSGSDELPTDVLAGKLPISPTWAQQHLRATHTGALRFIHGFGDSMSPTFQDGDILLVDTTQCDPAAIDGVYVLRAHGRLFVKRVRQNISGGLEISSDNPAVKTVDILDGSHEVQAIGRVIWVWNGRKV